MSETYTTDFQDVSDSDSTSFTPQDLVSTNAPIELLETEAQWRGDSDFTTNTSYDTTNFVSDSATAQTVTEYAANVNTESGETTGESETSIQTITRTNSSSGSYDTNENVVSVNPPDLPDNTTNVTSITVDYYVDEDSGGSDTGIAVEYDDDPFDLSNFDESTDNISINAYQRKRIGGFTFSVQLSLDEYKNDIDGGQINFKDSGDTLGTAGLVAEITVEAKVETVEQKADTEIVSVPYPSIPSGYNFSHHYIQIFRNDQLDDTKIIRSNKSPNQDGITTQVLETFSRETGDSIGDTLEIEVKTYGTKRTVQSQTATVTIPDGKYNTIEYHDIYKYRDGQQVDFDRKFSDLTGETVSITSNTTGKSVTVKAQTRTSKTVTNETVTRNARINYDFISSEIDTSNVCLLLDTSDSIDIPRLQTLAEDVINQMPSNGSLSVVSFDFEATELIALDTVSNIRSDATDVLSTLSQTGGTDIELGLEQANTSLDGNGGTIFLLTDGLSTATDPIPTATDLNSQGIDITTVSVGTEDINTELLQDIADLTGGQYFENELRENISGITLGNNELSEWIEVDGFGSGEQIVEHEIDGSHDAEFRIRFEWQILTPDPRLGTVGFYDSSEDKWKETAVANTQAANLKYTHVTVYNEDEDEWGALDVVDPTDDNAIESHQFYDENAGWLAPREYNTG